MFQQLYYDMDLLLAVLANQVLKSTYLSAEKQQLARQTISELTFENMKKQWQFMIAHHCNQAVHLA